MAVIVIRKITIIKVSPLFALVLPLVIFGDQTDLMNIHFIGNAAELQGDLQWALQELGHTISTVGSVHGQIDAVLLGTEGPIDAQELDKARELGLNIYSITDFLYEYSKHKTRVVIAGEPGRGAIVSMVLHVLHYNGIQVDFMVNTPLRAHGRRVSLNGENDFIILEGEEGPSSPVDSRPIFHVYRPNIALMGGMARESGLGTPEERSGTFVDSIVKGGSITFNEEDPLLRELVNASENPIRKFPYATPEHTLEGDVILLDTPEGEMPLEGFGKQELLNMAGAQWICQQLGVDQSDFFQAMTAFSN